MRVVDYFAGLGGFTLAATQAGATVVCAINHWPRAVETHRANHPEVVTRCEDLTRFDPRNLPAFEVLAGSPACQGHSPSRGIARGSEEDARWDASRATAWSIIDVAEVCRPRGIIVENVPAFLSWALFLPWRDALKRLGYGVTVGVRDSVRWGVPQERPRAFITAVLGKRAPSVPTPRAAEPCPVASVLDFDAGTWSPVERPGRSPATLARVASGRARFGARFVMPYNGSGSGLTGRDIARPIGTITAADRWAVVDGDRMRMLRLEEIRAAMGFPEHYQFPATRADATQMFGNAVVPAVAASGVRAVMEAA
jgi:DNA (cytosine-5)-methyltransferase 1